MKIKITENKKREIINHELKPLFINGSSSICIYGNVKFEEVVEKHLFGITTNIYLINCVLKFVDNTEKETFSVVDEAVENFFNRYSLQVLRKNYLSLKGQIKIFDKWVKGYNKKCNKKK